mgnify:CR=1 FL=1
MWYLVNMNDGAGASLPYVVTILRFNSEWLCWQTTAYGPFTSFREAEEFSATLPEYIDPGDMHEIGGISVTPLRKEYSPND